MGDEDDYLFKKLIATTMTSVGNIMIATREWLVHKGNKELEKIKNKKGKDDDKNMVK